MTNPQPNIAKALNTRRVVHKDGDTQDIINTILWADKQESTFKDTASFAPSLKGTTDKDSAYNVWLWVKRNIKYILDPQGIQWVKSPARTFSDGFADCKSRSIFIASLLRNLGIQYRYRFVSYSPHPVYTHVYVVAIINGQTYVLDPDMPGFNVEKPYRFKIDYMSKIEYLAGPGDKKRNFMRFRMHKAPHKMTDFDMSLAIRKQRDQIMKNKLMKKFGIGCPGAEKLQDRIDAMSDIIEVQSNPDLSKEEKLNEIAGIMEDVEAGEYNVSSSLAGIGDIGKRSAKRQEKKDQRKAKREQRKKEGKTFGQKLKKAGKTVVKAAAKAAKTIVKAATIPQRLAAKGILEITLPKIAPFFIYLFIKDKAIVSKMPEKARRKRKTAEKLAKFIIKGIGMKEAHFMGLVRNGIQKRYGKSPEAVLSDALKMKVSGIGALPLIPIILGLLPKILKLFKGNKAEADDIAAGLKDGEPDIGLDFGAVTDTVRKVFAKKVKTQKSRPPAEEAADDDGTGQDIPGTDDRKTKIC